MNSKTASSPAVYARCGPSRKGIIARKRAAWHERDPSAGLSVCTTSAVDAAASGGCNISGGSLSGAYGGGGGGGGRGGELSAVG